MTVSVRNYNVYSTCLTYHIKILLGNFNGKVGREDIFKLTAVHTEVVIIMGLEL
jgi:hypothetical protein